MGRNSIVGPHFGLYSGRYPIYSGGVPSPAAPPPEKKHINFELFWCAIEPAPCKLLLGWYGGTPLSFFSRRVDTQEVLKKTLLNVILNVFSLGRGKLAVSFIRQFYILIMVNFGILKVVNSFFFYKKRVFWSWGWMFLIFGAIFSIFRLKCF